MGPVEIILLVIAAVILAVNQGLRDAPNLTGKLPLLKPKSWWNYIPLGLALVAGVIWIIPSSPKMVPMTEKKMLTESGVPARASLDPNVLPESVSQSYLKLMSGAHTDLQEQRFLASHADKSIELSLKIVTFGRQGDAWLGQFYAGSDPSVFVMFSVKWEDHLLSKNVGEILHFQAKIIKQENGGYRLMDGRPV